METDQKGSTYFNLLDEPWILVRNKHGGTEELSVLQVFRRAHELVCLDCELPIQNIAILRFLLAIVYAVFTRVDEHGESAPLVDFDYSEQRSEALRRWKALWDMPELPHLVIEQYLEFYRDRFWLKHPTQPFYQVAGLITSDGSTRDASQMIMDVPSRDDRRFFSLRFGAGAKSLFAAEATRLLIALHAWDYAGRKAVVSDSFGNKGSENGGGTGWLGKLGIVYIDETTVMKTILMNLVMLDNDGALISFGMPSWEEPPRTALKLERQPSGYVDLLTLQSRRALLCFGDETVTGVTVSYGDVFNKENTTIEQMTAWHKSSQSKTVPILIPSTHKAGRSIWRDLSSLLPLASDNKDEKRVSGTVNWIRILRDNRILSSSVIYLAVAGIEYGPMQGVVSETIVDMLSVNSALLATLNQTWVYRVSQSLLKTEGCITQLGFFARKIAQASGSSDGNSEKDNARESAYNSFDSLFRRWLSSLNPEADDMEERMSEWKTLAGATIIKLGTELYRSANSQAIVGRIDERGSNIAAPIAYSQFRSSINKIMKSWKEDKNE